MGFLERIWRMFRNPEMQSITTSIRSQPHAPEPEDGCASPERMGSRLKEACEYLGLSQAFAALQLEPRHAVYLMEAGKRAVSAVEITQLARLYMMPVAHFLFHKSPVTDQLSVHPGMEELLSQLSYMERYEMLRFAEFLSYQEGGPRGKPASEDMFAVRSRKSGVVWWREGVRFARNPPLRCCWPVQPELTTTLLVRQALSSLPNNERLALVMYYVNGLSYGEIADFLEISPAAVRGRLYRGRDMLKKEVLEMTRETFESNRLDPEFACRTLQLARSMTRMGLGWSPDGRYILCSRYRNTADRSRQR
jgi:hypothetical protein